MLTMTQSVCCVSLFLKYKWFMPIIKNETQVNAQHTEHVSFLIPYVVFIEE